MTASRRQPIEAALSIIRHAADGESHEMPATQITALEPGDIIKVELSVAGQPTLGPSPLIAREKTADR
jgi:urease beta subunit